VGDVPGGIFITMPSPIVKNEMLAHWVYRRGELARRQLAKKAVAIAFAAVVALLIFMVLSWVFWRTVFFKNMATWVFAATILLLMAMAFYILRFLPAALFGIVHKLSPFKQEEVIITSAKIITEKKTWVVWDEKKQLSSVEWSPAAKPVELIFRGKEIAAGRPGRNYMVRLPVPADEYQNGEKIYRHFKQLLTPDTNPLRNTTE
jgi:hypothetical protein